MFQIGKKMVKPKSLTEAEKSLISAAPPGICSPLGSQEAKSEFRFSGGCFTYMNLQNRSSFRIIRQITLLLLCVIWTFFPALCSGAELSEDFLRKNQIQDTGKGFFCVFERDKSGMCFLTTNIPRLIKINSKLLFIPKSNIYF